MRNTIFILTGLLMISSHVRASVADTVSFGNFGKTEVYIPEQTANAFVILVSGSESGNKEVSDIARNINAKGALVARINLKRYIQKLNASGLQCLYPAGDFEMLAMYIQKKYKFRQYIKPVLIGYSTGSSFVYAVLAQSPAGTFQGAITLGFSPEITIGKPFCKGSGLNLHLEKPGTYYLEPCLSFKAPFIILQGLTGQTEKVTQQKQYFKGMASGELILLPQVGADFSRIENWLPQFVTAYNKVLNDTVQAMKQSKTPDHETPYISTLPLRLTPATAKEKLPLVLFISGDGGWKDFEQIVCNKLSGKGMPVVGLDALKYFWHQKRPNEVAEELSKVVLYYMKQWDRKSVILVGYSFGASIVPFIANDFPTALKSHVKGVYCFSPDKTSDFEIHIADMLSISTREKYDVLNELKTISLYKPVCIFGEKEDAKLQKEFSTIGVKIEYLPGEHHYNNDYNAIAAIILKDFPKGE